MAVFREETEGFSYVRCPFPDITGCDHMIIVRGYCTVGKYCIQNCIYAWLSIQDDA